MLRKSLKQWLIAANGWQRIWFVSSVLCILYGVIVFPMSETNRDSLIRYEKLWAVEREMKNPVCASYMNDAFEKLTYPDYSTDGSTCYHIYSHRKNTEHRSAVNEATYQQYFKSGEREIWLTYIGVGAFMSTLLSALVYGIGVTISWIISGFRRGKQQ